MSADGSSIDLCRVRFHVSLAHDGATRNFPPEQSVDGSGRWFPFLKYTFTMP